MNNKTIGLLLVSLIISLIATPAARADFGLHMYQDFNHASAGKNTITENASTAFNNPAGMGYLEGKHQFTVDLTYYMPSATFTDTGSTDNTGAPLTGDNGGDSGQDTPVPGFYYTYRLNDRWSLGATVNVPFGLGTEWDNNTWIGRYQSIEIGIETLNINPSASVKLNNAWSLGFGLSIQRADANMKNAIDFAAVCLDQLGAAVCNGIGIPPAPQSADGLLELEGNDTGYGFNFGLLYKQNRSTFGLTYRSKIDYTLEGSANFTMPPQAILFAPNFTDTTGKIDLTLPEVISLGYKYDYNKWSWMADATLTKWSRIKEYRIQFESGQADLVIPRNWEDTWRYAIGANYQYSNDLALQGGIAYAKSAIPDSNFDPTIPISNAYWVTLGVSYSPSKTTNMEFGISHIIFDDREINYTGLYGETVRGKIDNDLNVLSATLNWSI